LEQLGLMEQLGSLDQLVAAWLAPPWLLGGWLGPKWTEVAGLALVCLGGSCFNTEVL
jgi:hypothetical protein